MKKILSVLVLLGCLVGSMFAVDRFVILEEPVEDDVGVFFDTERKEDIYFRNDMDFGAGVYLGEECIWASVMDLNSSYLYSLEEAYPYIDYMIKNDIKWACRMFDDFTSLSFIIYNNTAIIYYSK